MSYQTLMEVFANRANISRKEARGAQLVFGGVRTTVGAVNAIDRLTA